MYTSGFERLYRQLDFAVIRHGGRKKEMVDGVKQHPGLNIHQWEELHGYGNGGRVLQRDFR